MKPRKYRAFIRDLRELCAKHGIKLTISSGGGGSHEALIFEDVENDRKVSVTIAKHPEVSAGVQRNVLKALGRYAVHEAVSDLASIVVEILSEIFYSGL